MLAVTTCTTDVIKIDAEAWHVDETHGLHLSDSNRKPVASFAATKWIAVVKLADE